MPKKHAAPGAEMDRKVARVYFEAYKPAPVWYHMTMVIPRGLMNWITQADRTPKRDVVRLLETIEGVWDVNFYNFDIDPPIISYNVERIELAAANRELIKRLRDMDLKRAVRQRR